VRCGGSAAKCELGVAIFLGGKVPRLYACGKPKEVPAKIGKTWLKEPLLTLLPPRNDGQSLKIRLWISLAVFSTN
jgi:hypothetical protein